MTETLCGAAELAEEDKRVNALTAQVARREATISAYGTALAESHARIEQLERERVGREPDGPALQYLPLSEVTDGHVTAYRQAYLAEARKYNAAPAPVELNACIRAGLAAIQWPTGEVEPDPEMREVPWNLRREGDTVTATWVKDEPMSADTAAFHIAGDGAGWLRDPVVTRPASPLPDKPGIERVIAALLHLSGDTAPDWVANAYDEAITSLCELSGESREAARDRLVRIADALLDGLEG